MKASVNVDTMPNHSYATVEEIATEYCKTELTAHCPNPKCSSARKFRNRDLIMCPSCRCALYWKRKVRA